MLVVTVLFRLKPAGYERFVQEVCENARLSLEVEPGCKRFEVSCAPDRHEVFLYEIYADVAAFDLHKKMSHYQDFSEITGPWIDEKTVRRFYIGKDNEDGE